jgi:acyl-coenzyme A thioesterase PaaI-like protein
METTVDLRVPASKPAGAVEAPGVEAWLRDLIPLYQHIGLRIERLDDVLACTVPLTEANANHLGGVHAAVQWAAAEVLGGLAYFAHPELGDCWIVVRDLTISFKQVARSALRAEATFDAAMVDDVAAQLAATGRADYEIAMSLHNTAGEVVTTAVGHYHLRRVESLPAEADGLGAQFDVVVEDQHGPVLGMRRDVDGQELVQRVEDGD